MRCLTVVKYVFLAGLYCIAAVCLFDFQEADTRERFTPPHEDIACATCHSLVVSIDATTSSGFIANQDCLRCHVDVEQSSSGTGRSLAFHSGRERSCLDCHSFHKPRLVQALDRRFEFDFENHSLKMQCRSCHDSRNEIENLSEGHRSAVELYHNNKMFLGSLSPSQSCLICHSKSSNWDEELGLQTPKFSEHASHPIGIVVAKGKGTGLNRIRLELDARLDLLNGKIECQTCHSLASTNEDRLVGYGSNDDFCLGCHEHRRSFGGF